MANAPPQPPSEPITMDGSSIDVALSSSSHLTHEELVTRRSRRLKQLSKIYRTHYWALMEELRTKYKEYYWKYGKSPFKENNNNNKNNGFGDLNNGKLGFDDQLGIRKCEVNGCEETPMALTKFCYSHILLDSEQKLYKGCTFVAKSVQGRRVLCGKIVLSSIVPALCPPHFQKAETYMAQALRKAGLNVSSPSVVAPKLHVIVREFVHQIQTKRRAARKENIAKVQMNGDIAL
ncbi:uncharacterized protein LOC126655862 [Mercurialis annua]|uniref:uncharacterized protein LOC126655862 n=1 Tax=Mercurialis annua TaxID=3986 RepID=UPI0021607F76|nr:uncharacterized protein LOC126655862 [Mercurialis annua]